MLSNISYTIRIKHKEGIFPKHDGLFDLYLAQLGDFFFDHQRDLDRIISKLEDFESKGFRGHHMDADLIGSKAIISDQYNDNPQEFAIEIDRTALIELVKAYKQLLEENTTEITLFRDDQTINIVGSFADKPEFKKTVTYRCKGDAFNEVKIAYMADKIYKIWSSTGGDYLKQIAKFLLDHMPHLNDVTKLLNEPQTEEIEQGHMHASCKTSKVIIIDMQDEFPYDNEIAIDRADLVTLIKAFQKLIAKQPSLITLQKNDDYITLIGTFGKDKPEYKETFSYRPRYQS